MMNLCGSTQTTPRTGYFSPLPALLVYGPLLEPIEQDFFRDFIDDAKEDFFPICDAAAWVIRSLQRIPVSC